MADPASRNPAHFSIFKTAAQEAAEMGSQGTSENEGDPAAAERQAAQSDEALELAIDELVFALHAEDVRMGVVRDSDVLDPGGALSAAGGSRYYRRAVAILRNLACVSDRQILAACAAEPDNTPRGAAARAELRLRGLAFPG